LVKAVLFLQVLVLFQNRLLILEEDGIKGGEEDGVEEVVQLHLI
jgi:hypothetical protein